MKIKEGTSTSDSDTSFESDSEMITSSDSSYSETDTASSGDTTPSGSPIRSTPSLLQRGPVPSLSFSLAGLQREDEGDGAPPTMRHRDGSQVDRPSIPPLSIDLAPVSTRRHPQPATSSIPPISVDIISPAFAINSFPSEESRHASSSTRQSMINQCAANLGMPSDRLKIYALTQLPPDQDLPEGCKRIAVEVAGSRFSLQAVEDILAENKKLSITQHQEPQHEQQEEEAGGDVKELRQQLEKLTNENTLLKTQLHMSESLRKKGHQALGELKQEFRALYKDLTTATPCHHPGNAIHSIGRSSKQQQREGTPAAVQEAGLVPGSV